jgi:hypothetical protein
VSDYGLDDRAIRVRSPAGAKDFSSVLSVQTGSGAHPTSCPMGTGGLFPGGKARPGRDADHSPPYSEWVGAIHPLPLSACMACSKTAFLQLIVCIRYVSKLSTLNSVKYFSLSNDHAARTTNWHDKSDPEAYTCRQDSYSVRENCAVCMHLYRHMKCVVFVAWRVKQKETTTFHCYTTRIQHHSEPSFLPPDPVCALL